jgi:hypothetical protein
MDLAPGRISSVVGIIAFLVWGIREAIEAIKRINTTSTATPPAFNFYTLAFYSLLAAFSGGLFWTALNSLQIIGQNPYMGGTSSEPHGIAPAVWVVVTTVPAVIILVILGRIYNFGQTRPQLLVYSAFLVGTIIGSMIFYDLPLDKNGLRNLLDPQNGSSLSKELWLVLLWSSLLSILGFLFMAFTQFLLAGGKNFRMLLELTELLLKQAGLCIALTTLSVTCFLLLVPNLERFDTARGVIAGLILRMTLFFGLFLGTRAVPPDPFVIFGIVWPRQRQNAPAAPQTPANPPASGSPPQAGP